MQNKTEIKQSQTHGKNCLIYGAKPGVLITPSVNEGKKKRKKIHGNKILVKQSA